MVEVGRAGERRIWGMAGETINAIVPLSFTYNNRAGQFLERFIKGLGQKRIMGVKCPRCNKVYLPPRSSCGKCFTPMTKWVEVSQDGTLHNFTIGHVTVENGEIMKSPSPVIIGMIKLRNATSLITAVVTGAAPEDLKPGLKVRAVWKEPPEESLTSLDHFEILMTASRKAR